MWWDGACGNWWCPPNDPRYNHTHPMAFRPYLLRIDHSEDVEVSNITMRNPGFWNCPGPPRGVQAASAFSRVEMIGSVWRFLYGRLGAQGAQQPKNDGVFWRGQWCQRGAAASGSST